MKWKKPKKMNKFSTLLLISFITLLPTVFSICIDSDRHDYCITKIDGTKTKSSSYKEHASACGDRKVTKPEECDPPESICVQDEWPGLCTTSCTCMPYKKDKVVENKTITIEKNETFDNQTAPNQTIQPETQVVPVTLTSEEIENATRRFEPVKPIAFNESIGIRAAYKVASFGHALWNWIVDIWQK